jgi:hypothetical protein
MGWFPPTVFARSVYDEEVKFLMTLATEGRVGHQELLRLRGHGREVGHQGVFEQHRAQQGHHGIPHQRIGELKKIRCHIHNARVRIQVSLGTWARIRST